MTKCHHNHHDHGGQRTVIHRRTRIRRPVGGGNGNTTVIIINGNGGGGQFGHGGGLPRIGPGLFRPGDGYPGSPGFDYGSILPSSTYTAGFGNDFFGGGNGFFFDDGFNNRGLTGNRSLDGILATAGGGVAANVFGGDTLAGAGGAGIGQIFGDGDPQKSAIIGGLAGAGIDFVKQGGIDAVFGDGLDKDGNQINVDGGSILASGISAGLNGLFNL